MICAAAVVPSPPLLVPEIAAGAVHETADLRAACDAAVAALVASDPDEVVVVGAAPNTGTLPDAASWDWRPYGVPLPPDPPALRLPLALAMGVWLLDRAGYAGPRRLEAVGVDAPVDDARRLGSRLAAGEARVALLVVGDGSARRTEKAPGHLDPRAEPFDAAATAALGAADLPALLALDASLAADLLAAGRAPWQVLAAAAEHAGWAPSVTYAGAPYGVHYVVAEWHRTD